MLFCNFDLKKNLINMFAQQNFARFSKSKYWKTTIDPTTKKSWNINSANWISYENYYVTQFNMYLESETSVGQSLVFRMFRSGSRIFVEWKTLQFLTIYSKIKTYPFWGRIEFSWPIVTSPTYIRTYSFELNTGLIPT